MDGNRNATLEPYIGDLLIYLPAEFQPFETQSTVAEKTVNTPSI